VLAAHCPNCGAANPVSVAEPQRYACQYCKYDGPPQADVSRRLEQAAEVVADLDQRKLQLSYQQQRALESGASSRVIYAGMLVVVTLPSVVLAKTCSSGPSFVSGWLGPLLVYGPIVSVLVFGGLGLRSMLRSRHGLEEACAAIPPQEPGMPARCHVCGAPLTPEPDAVCARCFFCKADNVVAQPVLARMKSRQKQVFHAYADVVRQEEQALDGVTVRATSRLLAAAFAGPLLSVVVVTTIAIYSLFDPFGPVDPHRRYLVVRGEDARCVGLVKDGLVFFGRSSPARGIPARLREPPTSEQQPITAQQLVGARVVAHDGREGTVTRAFQSPHGGVNHLELDVQGSLVYQPIAGTCFADGPEVRR
jgi:hypothetical protein